MLSRRLQLGGQVPITSPLHPNLVAMYTMDNISGSTLFDETPSSNDATLVGSPSTEAGVIGNALNLTATSKYVDMPSGVYGLNDSVGAVCYWVKMTNTSSGGIIAWGNGTSDQYWYCIANDGTSRVQLGISTGPGTGRFVRTLSTVTTNGVYVFIVAQCDGSSYEIWVNGANATLEVQTGPNDGSAWWDDNTYTVANIDRLPLGTPINYANSIFDQVRIFNRALTAAEISDLYNGGTGA